MSALGTSRRNGQLDFMSGFGAVRKPMDAAALPVATRMPAAEVVGGPSLGRSDPCSSLSRDHSACTDLAPLPRSEVIGRCLQRASKRACGANRRPSQRQSRPWLSCVRLQQIYVAILIVINASASKSFVHLFAAMKNFVHLFAVIENGRSVLPSSAHAWIQRRPSQTVPAGSLQPSPWNL